MGRQGCSICSGVQMEGWPSRLVIGKILLDLVYIHPGGVRTAMALFFSAKCNLRNTLMLIAFGHEHPKRTIKDSGGKHEKNHWSKLSPN